MKEPNDIDEKKIERACHAFDDYLKSDAGKLDYFNAFNPYGMTLDISGHSFDEAMLHLKSFFRCEGALSDTITFDLPPRFAKEQK